MISIAVCDDNEITAQEISEKVKQCCPIEAEVSVFYHIKDILFSIHNENKLFDIIFMDIEFTPGIQTVRLYILQIIQTILPLFMRHHIFTIF